MSSDGYVEYRASQQGDATYQDLGDQLSEIPEGNASEYAYGNESVMNKGKISKNDNADYEEVKNK